MKDNWKSIFIFIGSLFILLFLTTFFLSISGYYDGITNRRVISDEALKQFESDVLNGEKIVASNYISEQETYDNLLSRICIRIGDLISNIFKKIMSTFMKEINQAID